LQYGITRHTAIFYNIALWYICAGASAYRKIIPGTGNTYAGCSDVGIIFFSLVIGFAIIPKSIIRG
jgi:hypothetical protein